MAGYASAGFHPPKPYYQDDAVTIYHGDCREVLPQLGPVDLVLTDPPYGGMAGGTVHAGLGGVAKTYSESLTVGTPWSTELDWIPAAWDIAALGMMVFASYHNVAEVAAALPSATRVALLTWYKRNSPPAMANVPRFTTEFVWLFKKRPGLNWRALKSTMIDTPLLSAGCMATERFVDDSGRALHPTQKPLSLIIRLLSVGGDLILDPFMGSGTTLRAAKDLGRKGIGIEIEERYCEIAAKRMAQGVLAW